MEIKAENYLINYYANSSDFRIIIYNIITTKKYETIKTSDDYKMYKDIGLDIFEIIKNCLDNILTKVQLSFVLFNFLVNHIMFGYEFSLLIKHEDKVIFIIFNLYF